MPLATGSPRPQRQLDRPRLPLEGNGRQVRDSQDDVGMQTDQLLRERSYPIVVIAVPPKVDPHVAAIDPTQVRKGLRERRGDGLRRGIVFVAPHKHADAPNAVALRARRERPCDRRAAEEGDE